MDYSPKTAKLLAEICSIAERKDYDLDKTAAEKYLLQTYDLFGLPRPKKIVWSKDIFSEGYARAYSAYGASSSYGAYRAYGAYSAYRASSAYSAYRAYMAYRSYRSYSAIDYDFDLYMCVFEYNQSNNDGNENDKKYLQYCELLLKAKKAGAGYWLEAESVLHLVPCPLIEINDRNQFHSDTGPAIRWKDGKSFYYLQGVEFEKELWGKVIKNKLSARQVFALKNMEQRRVAYSMMDKAKMKALKDYKVLDEGIDHKGKPHKIISFNVAGFDKPFIYYQCVDSTTDREYFVETDKDKCWEAKAALFGLKANEIQWNKEW